jgi:hypothetical protein
MGVARAIAVVELPPEAAFDLWTDLSRWRTFIDGFGHTERVEESWPAPGAKLVWRSVPTGRGIVTERVLDSQRPGLFSTQVLEERLTGTQTTTFDAHESGGTAVELSLDYRLAKGGPLARVTDVIFIRRAQNDALARTLRRFATEAAEQAAL